MTEKLSENGFPIGKTPFNLFDDDFMEAVIEQEGHAEHVVSDMVTNWSYQEGIPEHQVLTDPDYERFLDYVQKHFRSMAKDILENTTRDNDEDQHDGGEHQEADQD